MFSDSVREQNREGVAGELAVIFDRDDKFLAIGLFDPGSPLRVRVLHCGKPVTIDAAWWLDRLRKTLARRADIATPQTNGYRLIHGESDGWPGLVLDRYDSVLVLKLYTAAWFPHLNDVISWLAVECRPERIILRLSRNLGVAAEVVGRQDGTVVFGDPGPPTVVFRENGLKFEADVLRGQKTGFFLDQRENRQWVGEIAAGAHVLNAFSFSGGFSLYAARGGARHVTDLDLSRHALESGTRNFELNAEIPSVLACHREAVQTDVFEWFRTSGRRQFDLVILDPPSLAKREVDRPEAIEAYAKLAQEGMHRVTPGGCLVAASCSGHVSAEQFFATVRSALSQSTLRWSEIRTTQHPADHPSTFPEGNYLKAIYLRTAG